ncbi:hypothetical protein K438DRAFT_1959613 [Mycena galopus ATCC 62051]|nr:hypothetical protein K438DRAFT_1959613 [Mycena galopus ATCC 62051]
MAFIEMIDQVCVANQKQIPPESELVLELRPDSETGENYCGYYVVHHKSRSISWLSEEVELDLTEVRGGQIRPEHMKLHLESQYWTHFEYFETMQVVSPSMLHEIRGIVINSLTDGMTSKRSTVTHSEKQLTNMLKIVDEAMKDLPKAVEGSRFQLEESCLAFESPRLSRCQSIYKHEDKRSWFITIISPILFHAPDVHLRSMDKIWVDEIAAKGPWVKFIERLISEWTEHTAFAYILLNINVAFLDIPGVESEGSTQPLAQVFSSISLVLCLASAILGLRLVRHHRTKRIGTAAEAVKFFTTHHLETTAIMYSLPYVLLMYRLVIGLEVGSWAKLFISTAFFLAAFMMTCFLWTSMTMRLAVGVFWALSAILVSWCLVWQGSESSTTGPSWLGYIKSQIKWETTSESGEHDGDEENQFVDQKDVTCESGEEVSLESLHNQAQIV